MKKHIFITRHGETPSNRSWTYQGTNSEMTPRGRRQALQLAEAAKALGLDAIISSDIERAQHTARAVGEAIGIPLETSALFRELGRPSYLIGKHFFDPRALVVFAQLYLRAADSEWHYQDEENYHDFRERAFAALEFLAHHSSAQPLVVTHRIFIGALLTAIRRGRECPPRAFVRESLSHALLANCSLTELQYDTDTNEWSIIRVNDTRHLK